MEGTSPAFALSLLGGVAVGVDGRTRALPASRKTRALLAYLATSGKPERRETLCELLWDVPDDPRGALRWSLSKLRGVLDGIPGVELRANRERIELVVPDASVDWRRLRDLIRRGPPQADTAVLEEAARSSGVFLQGLDLPRCERFQGWLIAHREDARQWTAQVLAELTGRPLKPDQALPFARAWVDGDPHNPAAWQRLVDWLERAGRSAEAEEQRALGAQTLGGAGALVSKPSARSPAEPAPIRFCTSRDGTRLAFTVTGSGPPLVKIANWMTHLELDAQGPIWGHWIEAFSRTRRLVRYDQRGNGLSDLDAEFSEAAYVEDVEAVVAAAGLDRFDLLGISHGASVAVAYAARHPERVRRLVLLGGFPVGWSKLGNAEEAARREAMITLTAQGWERDNPALRQLFTSLFLPDSIPDEQHWFTEVQRKATPVANACAIQRGTGKTDVRELLPHVRVPTLVAHARNDAMVSFAAGRALAAAIPGARFLALEGSNHVLVSGEPAWARFRDAALAFLDEPL